MHVVRITVRSTWKRRVLSWCKICDPMSCLYVCTCLTGGWQHVQAVYSFWQYEVCDVFIELIKPVMSGGDAPTQQATRETLYTCLDQGLRYAPPPPSMLPSPTTFIHCDP